jgi:mannose-1-phosphate guanylyltransferase
MPVHAPKETAMKTRVTHKRICVIMAGGSGERFWPLSRRLFPKQLLRLTRPDQSLLEETVERIAPVIPARDIFVATTCDLLDAIRGAGAGGVPPENVLAEPCKRNTMGCLAWVTAQALARFREEAERLSIAVLTADHLVPDGEKFRRAVEATLSFVEENGVLGTIGIAPTRPETGYGYIEIAEGASPLAEVASGVEIFPVTRFREKPNAASAAEFLSSGRHLWNSGMFFWTLPALLDEINNASPSCANVIRTVATALEAHREDEAARLFEGLDSVSIDCALMEKARRVVVTRADFPWDDIGAWDSLERTHPRDSNGNVGIGDPVIVDSRGCIVYNAPGTERMAVAAIGVDDLAIIVSEDGVLVVPKSRAQDVRRAVDALKERGDKHT